MKWFYYHLGYALELQLKKGEFFFWVAFNFPKEYINVTLYKKCLFWSHWSGRYLFLFSEVFTGKREMQARSSFYSIAKAQANEIVFYAKKTLYYNLTCNITTIVY